MSAAPKRRGSTADAPVVATHAGDRTLTVRPACRGDLVPLSFFFDAVLRRDYFLRRGQLADMFQSPYHTLLIAEIDHILVGAAVLTRGTRLVNVLVHPAYRGLGIGRALVQLSGATEVRVKLDMSTGDPRAFYRALGFVACENQPSKSNIQVMHLPAGATRRRQRGGSPPVSR